MAENEQLMTAQEVASYLGVHINSVKRIPRSELRFYRISSRGDRRYKPSDVEHWLRSKTLRPQWWEQDR